MYIIVHSYNHYENIQRIASYDQIHGLRQYDETFLSIWPCKYEPSPSLSLLHNLSFMVIIIIILKKSWLIL